MDLPRRPPPALMEELVEDILIRLPPDDPASLVRAALVCKEWRRLVSGASFRRRFRELHRTAPLLGFISTTGRGGTRFMPTSSFRLPHPIAPSWHAVGARHGRILFYDVDPAHGCTGYGVEIIVWNPIDGEVRRLPMLPLFTTGWWNAALLCTAAGSDHLHCGPFHVVFVTTDWSQRSTSAFVYSQEQNAWSQPVSLHHPAVSVAAVYVVRTFKPCSAVVGNAVYFVCEPGTEILEYDLGKKKLSAIKLFSYCRYMPIALMTAEDGGLGFAMVKESKLYLWSRKADFDGDTKWEQQRVIELDKLFSIYTLPVLPYIFAVADGGGVIFVKMVDNNDAIVLTVDLKSCQARKLFEGHKPCETFNMVPYICFYIPVRWSRTLHEADRELLLEKLENLKVWFDYFSEDGRSQEDEDFRTSPFVDGLDVS
ncbi:hypothetical protein ACP70R_015136 [Stipagrostis hirtigluma subsp. patula]